MKDDRYRRELANRLAEVNEELEAAELGVLRTAEAWATLAGSKPVAQLADEQEALYQAAVKMASLRVLQHSLERESGVRS